MLIITDTNIFINLEKANLLEDFFNLPYDIGIPDYLGGELRQPLYDIVLELGVIEFSLSTIEVSEQVKIIDDARGMSHIDVACFIVAKREKCPLVTNDKKLRQYSDSNGVEIKGIIWVLEELSHHINDNKNKLKGACELFLKHPHMPIDELKQFRDKL